MSQIKKNLMSLLFILCVVSPIIKPMDTEPNKPTICYKTYIELEGKADVKKIKIELRNMPGLMLIKNKLTPSFAQASEPVTKFALNNIDITVFEKDAGGYLRISLHSQDQDNVPDSFKSMIGKSQYGTSIFIKQPNDFVGSQEARYFLYNAPPSAYCAGSFTKLDENKRLYEFTKQLIALWALNMTDISFHENGQDVKIKYVQKESFFKNWKFPQSWSWSSWWQKQSQWISDNKPKLYRALGITAAVGGSLGLWYLGQSKSGASLPLPIKKP